MRKVHPTSIKTLSNPLTKRVVSVERLIAQENARDRQANTLEDLADDLNSRTSLSDEALGVYAREDNSAGVRFYQDMDGIDTELGEIFTYATGTSAQMNIHAKAVTDAPWEHAALNMMAYNNDDYSLGYHRPRITVGSDGIATVVAPRFYLNLFISTPNSAPTVAVGAAGSVPVGTYRYGVTFTGGVGETPLVDEAISGMVTIPTWAAQIDLTDIPIGPDGSYMTSHRNIYRMNTATGDWGLVGTIANNTDTTYTDNSASIGAAPPLWNSTGALWFGSNTNNVVNANGQTMLAVNRCWPPPAPVAAQVATGTGNIPNGTYRYKVVFYDGANTSSGSPASNAVVVDNTHKRTTVTLPIGPENITNRYIYRVNTATGAWEYLGLVADNTTVSYTDNIAAGSSSEPARTSGIYLPTSPTYHKWKLYEATANKTLSRGDSTVQTEGEYWAQATGTQADGDWLRFPGFVAEGGNYTVAVLGVTATFRGILDWYIDGVLVEAGQDWYAGSTTTNVEQTFTASLTAGWHQLTAIINGKNASSSNYYYGLTSVRLQWVSR